MSGFIDALRLEKFSDENFKIWQMRAILQLSVINELWISKGKPKSNLTQHYKKAYIEANTLFMGVMIGTPVDHLHDVYLHLQKQCDALEADYGGTDSGTKLYFIEQYHDYKITNEKSVVEQAHEIQYMVKELEHLKINLPGKFVAVGIIFKFSP